MNVHLELLPQAWCYRCKRLRPFAVPVPAVKTITVPLGEPLPGARVDRAWLARYPANPAEHIITMRVGTCAECGAELSRVGGGRQPREPRPDDDSQGDLFAP